MSVPQNLLTLEGPTLNKHLASIRTTLVSDKPQPESLVEACHFDLMNPDGLMVPFFLLLWVLHGVWPQVGPILCSCSHRI